MKRTGLILATALMTITMGCGSASDKNTSVDSSAENTGTDFSEDANVVANDAENDTSADDKDKAKDGASVDAKDEAANNSSTDASEDGTSSDAAEENANSDASNDDPDTHFLNYIEGNEKDLNGDSFWGIGEQDLEYALYDLNGDGKDELIVRTNGYWINDIIQYKDSMIQPANVKNLGSSGVTFINTKNQFVSGDIGHVDREVYAISEINENDDADVVLYLANYTGDFSESGSPEYYKKENPQEDYLENSELDVITEDEYNSLVEEYTQENTQIEWNTIEVKEKSGWGGLKKDQDEGSTENMTEEEALAAVKNYCYEQNPDLKDIEEAGEYVVYWEVEPSVDGRIVVLFRSYTAAETRYYIDPATGETYVTELVPGIIDEEERTEETLNMKDYMK